jgi:hypothetical protein
MSLPILTIMKITLALTTSIPFGPFVKLAPVVGGDGFALLPSVPITILANGSGFTLLL